MKYRVGAIDPATYSITEPLGGVRAYLLLGTTSALLIDTGNGVGDLRTLTKTLTDLPVGVVCTHAHLDHTNGNYQFPEARLPAGEEPVAELYQNKTEIRAAFRRMLPLPLRALVRMIVPQMITPRPYRGRFDLQDNEAIDLGGRRVEVVSLPGHTAHSAAFFDRDRNYLFPGDTVVDNTVLLNLPGSAAPDAFYRSMQKLLTLADGRTQIFPGHNKIPQNRALIERFYRCAELARTPDASSAFGSESGYPCRYIEFDGVRLALRAN